MSTLVKKDTISLLTNRGGARSCVLSTPLKVRRGNEVVTCLADSRVYVSISSNEFDFI